MNKKFKTISTWLAAAVFLFALAINVKVSLDDPFALLSDEAIAQTTSTSSSSSNVEPEILQKIKDFCSCYTGNMWRGMSITKCEDYVWQIPMARTSCGTSSCPPGSACR